MKRRKVLSLFGLAVGTGGLAIACAANNPRVESPSPVASAASSVAPSGEKLTIYSGRDKKLIGDLITKFEQETGIKVEVRYGDTAELAAAILEEGNNSPADIFFAQDAGALGAMQKAGRTSQLPEQLFNQVDPRYRAVDGQWVGITGRVRTVDYNTKLVKPEELPTSIFGFTDPKWKNKIGWAPTNGSFQAFVTALRKSAGEEKAQQWLEGIKANNPKTYPKNTPIIEALSRGEIAVGFVNHYYLEKFKQENPQAPIAHHYTKDVGALVNVAGITILNSAKQPQLAQKFGEFLLGKEAQQYFATKTFEYPLATGTLVAGDVKALDQIQPTSQSFDLSNLNDLDATLKLLETTGVL